MKFGDIYRGYTVRYGHETPEPYYAQVYLDGVKVHDAHSYDDALAWIDAEKRKQAAKK